MQHDTAIPFPPPQRTIGDPGTAVGRQGAQRLLAQAIESGNRDAFRPQADRHDPQGRPRWSGMAPFQSARGTRVWAPSV